MASAGGGGGVDTWTPAMGRRSPQSMNASSSPKLWTPCQSMYILELHPDFSRRQSRRVSPTGAIRAGQQRVTTSSARAKPCEVERTGGCVSRAAGHASSCRGPRSRARMLYTLRHRRVMTRDQSAAAPPHLRGRARPRHIERRTRRLTRASTPRRRRDGVTATADPRGAAPRSLLASRETTRAVLWKARPWVG